MAEMIGASIEFIRQAREDLANASALARAAFCGSVAVVGAHIIGAEALYANVGVSVFNATEANPLLTGLAVGGASAALEMASTLIVSKSTTKFPRVSRWLMRQETASEDDQVDLITNEINVDLMEPTAEIEKKTSFGELLSTSSLVIGAGSPGYILHEWGKEPKKTFSQNLKIGSKAAGALATMNFALGAGIAATLKYAQEIGPTAEKIIQKGITHPLLDGIIPAVGLFPIIKSPLTWVGLFTVGRLLNRNEKLSKA